MKTKWLPRVGLAVCLLAFAGSVPSQSTTTSAVALSGYERVLPDANARQVPVPQVSDSDTRPDAEFVSTIVHLQTVPAGQLVPILRPLLPQMAHLAALPCKNALIIVDSFANVRRIEALIRTLDTGEPYKPEKCAPLQPHESGAQKNPTPPPRES